MRKVVVSEFVSLDGVVENPAWTAPYWGDDIAQFKSDENLASDVLLLGRVTYEGFAKSWPEMKDEDGAGRMNSLPKFVASRTLDKLEWNAQPIKGDIKQEVTKLKEQPGQNILVYGSADFVDTLMQHNLVDEYWFLIYPVVVGKGKRLFKDGRDSNLKLFDTRTFNSGVVALGYHPV